jgi:hypothetical protein
MKVVLRHDISGTRNGEPWPPAGAELDLPDAEAAPLLASGAARPVNTKDAEVEKRVAEAAGAALDESTKATVKRATVTRERQAVSKRAHEPVNLGVADDNQPAEDVNGPRLPEVAAAESATVEDPATANPYVEADTVTPKAAQPKK